VTPVSTPPGAPATGEPPTTLRVLRYEARDHSIRPIVGGYDPALPLDELRSQARCALRERGFVCHAAGSLAKISDGDLCFVPRGDHCEIVSIRTDLPPRHHGDHRRSLTEILGDIAAAVARDTLHFLDDDQLKDELKHGIEVVACGIDDPGSLAQAREAVSLALEAAGASEETQRRMKLCVSEATTNILIHGGGRGTMSLRRLDDRMRVVVADKGPGLDFLNWVAPGARADQPSMGYGYKIILDNLQAVYLHTGGNGTTLLLDRAI
jgi:anti-sigma regulatory factor (Ser/Thr protein kinase)